MGRDNESGKRVKKPIWWGAIAATVILSAMVLQGLDAMRSFELPKTARLSDHEILVQGGGLAGTLALPADHENPAVVVIVHGDGPQDRWSDATYLPLINVLLDAGIGVFSWDKPGVGESTGDWLTHSMADRAREAVAVYDYLRETVGISGNKLGFLGFSQAGWVVPQATLDTEAAYAVLIGPAINWRSQGAYYTSRRLEQKGIAPDEIAQAVARNLSENDALFGAGGDCARREDITAARCGFVKRSYLADATVPILEMTTPALVLMGAEDLNVDPADTATTYAENALHDVRIIPEATHSLLRAEHYNFQTPADWTAVAGFRFMMSGAGAYAPGVLDQITQWIDEKTR
ncbi:alpha/beta fold hydrolase [uncultured Roseobacter sp.]|uniref:alpha/beta hydrolase family protein n=1 Tax=uncultured Roseobacter sp. TaxID=114847 RepID=UPI002631FDAC|nr:alpha/beta fold hydrolase [uncultured Roseobacter sp.]